MTDAQKRAIAIAKAKQLKANQDSVASPAPAGPSVPDDMFLNPETGQMTSRDLLRNNMDPTQLDAVAAGGTQGMTLGFGDELAGVAAGVSGGPDAQKFATEKARAFQEASSAKFPNTYTGAEIGGAVITPAKAATTVKGAAVVGGLMGGAYKAGTAEGSAVERAGDFGKGVIIGGFTAGTGAIAFKGISSGLQKLLNKSGARPTVPLLKATKSAAYKAVDGSGEVFKAAEVDDLILNVLMKVDDGNYVPGVDKQTDAALALLQRQEGRDITIGRLDKIRQNLWARYSKADNEVDILDAIAAIDDLIDSKAGSSDLMKAARLANSRFRKAEMLEDAFTKAQLQTAGTGSGGNVLNKYRQAVTSIVTNPKKAKWFSPEELDLMDSFVRGSITENVQRKIGKLAPGGNGLMSALNLYAAAVDPTMLAATATATASKALADRSVRSGSEALLDAVSTGVIRQPSAGGNIGRAAQVAGVGSNALLDY